MCIICRHGQPYYSSDAPLDKFSSAVDAYIDALPLQKTSKLKKRKDVVVEALYKKPAVSAATGLDYQGKTRQSRPFDPSKMVSVKIPRTMRDVLISPLSSHWLAAKDKECNSFKEQQTYKLPSPLLLDLHPQRSLLRSPRRTGARRRSPINAAVRRTQPT